MTATLPTTTPPAGAGTGTPVPVPAPRRAPRQAGRARRVLLDTPRKLWALLLGLLALSVAWGVIGGLVTNRHAAAADSLASVNARLTFDSRHMYQSIADADATITAAFLASPTPPLRQLQRYEKDLETAHANLSELQSDEVNPAIGPALASLGAGLSAYSGYVAEATAEYADNHPLTGGSFLQVASEEAHLTLLPAAGDVFTKENAQLNAASSQATGYPTIIGLLFLAVVIGIALYLAQRWLYRRTNRVFSPGLALASVVLFGSVVWLLAAFFGARADLDRGIGHGSAPAQTLALASIGVQQIRGDSVLNVISRSGNASFSDDFAATHKNVDTWLSEAASAQDTGQGSNGASLVAAAQRDTAAWYAANQKVYTLGVGGDYAGERDLVVGSVPGNTVTGYNALEGDLSAALKADQDVFSSAVADGADALDPLTGGIAAASLLMVLGCGWAVTRRLAEYR
ncbi:MAG TPA: hypothetical protein VN714_34910 [Trebonia sp.]|nr:hypothetical protein [Trebonia sp.]